MPSHEEVVEALRGVEDPELGMDIVELGLFYDAEIEGKKVKVTFTLTSMGCPVGPMIEEDIRRVVSEIPDPEADSGMQVFDVIAAGVNYADTHQTEDSYLAKQQLPFIPGSEVVVRDADGARLLALVGIQIGIA